MPDMRGRWKRPGTLMQRIRWRSERRDTGCIEWTGGRSPKGYALLWWQGRTWRVTRLLWTVKKGAIPRGLRLLHRCDNPGCINLRHLFLGTDTDNMRDRDRKQRQARGERAGGAKLTARRVRYLRRVSTTAITLSERWNISVTSICRARNGETWKHL